MNPWAAQIVGREDEGYRWGDSKEEVIDEVVAAELERRECECDDGGPIEVLVHGGCTWTEIPEDERDPDEAWTHWLEGWASTERVTVVAP
jgi:hypothetical protein